MSLFDIPNHVLKSKIFSKLDTVSTAIVRLVCKRWAKLISPVQCPLNKLIEEAARGGYIKLCWLAREWGATDYNGMLYSAALGGHKDLCCLAKEWGATDYNLMLRKAAGGGHKNLCWLAKKWGATNFDWMANKYYWVL